MEEQEVLVPRRCTDVSRALFQLGGKAPAADVYAEVAKIREARGETLPQYHENSVRNDIQRHSADYKEFANQRVQLDLFGKIRNGVWCLHDWALPQIETAANRATPRLLLQPTRLLLPKSPVVVTTSEAALAPYVIGEYAQRLLKTRMEKRGYHVLDTSTIRAYDFMFQKRGARTERVQYMECKGTRAADIISLPFTDNECRYFLSNYSDYWLGIVSNITTTNGRPSGGEVAIVDPPIDRPDYLSVRMVVTVNSLLAAVSD